MSVLLQLALGHFPPLLPIIPNHIWDEHLLDLVYRRTAAIALQDELDQLQMMHLRHLSQGVQVRRLARQDVGRADGLQRLSRKAQIPRVSLLVLAMDDESRRNRIAGGNLSE